MDFINKAYARLAELFRSMTPAARVTTGLLLAVIVISLVYLFYYQAGGGGGEYLLGGREFSQSDLANMTAAFSQKELKKWKIVGNRIEIPSGEKAAYMAALADGNALPEDFTRYIDEALNSGGVFGGGRYLLDQKLKHAKEKELSLIIARMRGIESARVQFEQDERRGFRPSNETRALAVVKPVGNTELDEERVQTVLRTVAAGVRGLKLENVTVTDLNRGTAYSGGSEGGLPGITDSIYLSHKMRWEKWYADKIRAALVNYPGAVVGVNVELDNKLRRKESRQQFDPKTVPVFNQEQTENQTKSGSQNGGRPGLASNGITNSPASVGATAGSESSVEKTQSQQQSVASRTVSESEEVGLTPTRVTATVGIPTNYYEKLWQKRNPTPAGQEAKSPTNADLLALHTTTASSIKPAVEVLLREGEGPAAADPEVNVRMDESLPAETLPAPGVTDQAFTWFAANWQTLGMFVVGLFGLLMLRRMVASAPDKEPASEESAITLQLPAIADGGEDDAAETGEPHKLKRRFGTSGPNLRAELSELVKEDPDAAANILRNWIGDAA